MLVAHLGSHHGVILLGQDNYATVYYRPQPDSKPHTPCESLRFRYSDDYLEVPTVDIIAEAATQLGVPPTDLVMYGDDNDDGVLGDGGTGSLSN